MPSGGLRHSRRRASGLLLAPDVSAFFDGGGKVRALPDQCTAAGTWAAPC